MMLCLMFQSLNLALVLVNLFFLLQNFGIACLMMCVHVSLLPPLNLSLRLSYFVKPSISFWFSFVFLVVFSIFCVFHLLCFSLFLLLSWGDSLISLVRQLSRRWYTLISNPGVIASLAWEGSYLGDGTLRFQILRR